MNCKNFLSLRCFNKALLPHIIFYLVLYKLIEEMKTHSYCLTLSKKLDFMFFSEKFIFT